METFDIDELEQELQKTSSFKNIYIYILIALFLLGGVIVFFFVNKKTREYKAKQEYQVLHQKVEQEIDTVLKSEDINEIVAKDPDKPKISTGAVLSGYDEILTTDKQNTLTMQELKEAYGDALMKGEEKAQIDILIKMYDMDKDTDIVYLIIDKSLSAHDFDTALNYTKMLYEQGHDMTKLGLDTFFYVLLNGLELNEKNLDHIQELADIYHKREGLLSADQYYFYSGLINLGRGYMDGFEQNLSEIGTGTYDKLLQTVNNFRAQYESYKDVPYYYYKALISYTMMQLGYYTIAQGLSQDVLDVQEDYILPNQVMAYSYFITNKYTQSKEYLKRLIVLDKSNQQIYKFFLGISQFWDGKYSDAVVFLSQIKSADKYYKDALRYMMLSYHYLNEDENMLENMRALIEMKPLSSNDYYTFFDVFFYKPWSMDQEFTLYQNNSELVLAYIKGCIKDLPSRAKYVCYYGKAGYYLAKGQEEISSKYLSALVKYYPRGYIFKRLGDMALKQKDYDEAKRNYLKAVLYTQDVETKRLIKQKLLFIILKEQDK